MSGLELLSTIGKAAAAQSPRLRMVLVKFCAWPTASAKGGLNMVSPAEKDRSKVNGSVSSAVLIDVSLLTAQN